MKIIKQGDLNYKEILTLTCRHCGCVVEVSKEEMSVLNDQGRAMQYVECPTCPNRIYK